MDRKPEEDLDKFLDRKYGEASMTSDELNDTLSKADEDLEENPFQDLPADSQEHLPERTNVLDDIPSNWDKEIKPIEEERKERYSSISVAQATAAEEKRDKIQTFKNALSTRNGFRAFFNSNRSELILYAENNDGTILCRTLRFKVCIDNDRNEPSLVDISFGESSSIWIYNDCVVCYIDEKMKMRHRQVYQAFGHWILYSDLKASSGENLVLRKLFMVTRDDMIVDRCLVTDETDLFLIAGKSYRFKKNSVVEANQLSKYQLRYLMKPDQPNEEFIDHEADNLDSVRGECVSAATPRYIFICKKTGPTKMEIYDKDGYPEDTVDLPFSSKGFSVDLTYVSFRGKDEILFTLRIIDHSRKFYLYSIDDKSFEEKEVTLKEREGNRWHDYRPLYSGFEELEVNTNSKPIKDNIMIYDYRYEARFVVCRLEVAEK